MQYKVVVFFKYFSKFLRLKYSGTKKTACFRQFFGFFYFEKKAA